LIEAGSCAVTAPPNPSVKMAHASVPANRLRPLVHLRPSRIPLLTHWPANLCRPGCVASCAGRDARSCPRANSVRQGPGNVPMQRTKRETAVASPGSPSLELSAKGRSGDLLNNLAVVSTADAAPGERLGAVGRFRRSPYRDRCAPTPLAIRSSAGGWSLANSSGCLRGAHRRQSSSRAAHAGA
jgi:hypothetical protein